MLQTGIPRHEQLSNWLRDQIEREVYQADDQLPSESQLGERFGVSRITVRRALQTLESEGLIYRRQGLGSFVRSSRLGHGLVLLTDFVEDMTRAGLHPSSRVTYYGEEPATPFLANRLGVGEGTTVFRLDRLRLGDDEPIAFDRTWLPARYARLLEGHDLERQSLYRILESEYEIPVVQGYYRIDAVNAGAEVAAHLGVAEGQALLLIERTSITHEERRVYYQRRYYRSDRVVYELLLERPASGRSSAARGMPLQEFEPVFRQRREAP